jgi:hypothetical protein
LSRKKKAAGDDDATISEKDAATTTTKWRFMVCPTQHEQIVRDETFFLFSWWRQLSRSSFVSFLWQENRFAALRVLTVSSHRGLYTNTVYRVSDKQRHPRIVYESMMRSALLISAVLYISDNAVVAATMGVSGDSSLRHSEVIRYKESSSQQHHRDLEGSGDGISFDDDFWAYDADKSMDVAWTDYSLKPVKCMIL